MSQSLFDLSGGYTSPFPDESMHLYSDLNDISINYRMQAYDLGIVELTNYDNYPRIRFSQNKIGLRDETNENKKSDESDICDLSDLDDESGISTDEGGGCNDYLSEGSGHDSIITNFHLFNLDLESIPVGSSSPVNRSICTFKDILRACRKDTFHTMNAGNSLKASFTSEAVIYRDAPSEMARRTRRSLNRIKRNIPKRRRLTSPWAQRYKKHASDHRIKHHSESIEALKINCEVDNRSSTVTLHPILGQLGVFRKVLTNRVFNLARWLGFSGLHQFIQRSQLTFTGTWVHSNSPVFQFMKSLGFPLNHSSTFFG